MNLAISKAWDKIQGMINGLIVMLPNLVLALIVFAVFYSSPDQITGQTPYPQASPSSEFRAGARTFVPGNCHLVGLFVALSIVIPTFKAGDLVNCWASAVWQLVLPSATSSRISSWYPDSLD